MKNLSVVSKGGIFTVDSREVAEMIEKEHNKLMRDIRSYIEYISPVLDTSSFFVQSTYLDSYEREQPCYLLTKKGCDMVANKMTGEKGVLFTAAYVTKFNEMESQSKTSTLPELNSKFLIQLAQAMEEKEKQILKLETKVEKDLPKVLFAESVQASSTTILVRELSKILNQNGIDIGQNRMFQWLKDNGYLIKNASDQNSPTQKAMNLGLFEIKETAITRSNGTITIQSTPKVTGKGQLYFVNKFLADKSVKKSTNGMQFSI